MPPAAKKKTTGAPRRTRTGHRALLELDTRTSSSTAANKRVKREVTSSEATKKNLFELLGGGPLWNIFTFLDAKELSLAASTCRILRYRSDDTVWERVVGAANDKPGRSDASTPKERAQRHYKARKYTEHMEILGEHHFNYDNRTDDPPVHCGGCENFPDLDLRVFQEDANFEFFVRFAYREPTESAGSNGDSEDSKDDEKAEHNREDLIIWEGFVHAMNKEAEYDPQLEFDMQHIYPYMQWASIQDLLRHYSQHGFVAGNDNEDDEEARHLTTVTMDNLKLTLIAIERARPYRTSLVITTGGYHDTLTSVGDVDHDEMMNPRKVHSHSLTGDWVSSVVKLGQPRQQHPEAFRGFDITYMQY